MISLSSHLSSIPTPNILDQVRKKEREKGFIIFQFWFSILSRLIWIVLNTCILKKIHNEGCSYMSWFYQFGEQFGSITISPKHYIEKTKLHGDTLDACVLSRFSHVQIFGTLWTVAHQASLSMGFSRQEYWTGCHALL